MSDTTPDIRKVMIEMIGGLSPQERLEKSCRLFTSGWELAEIAVKRRDAHLAGVDLKLAVFRLMYQSSLSLQSLDEVEQLVRAETSEKRTAHEAL